jgi:alanine racemase
MEVRLDFLSENIQNLKENINNEIIFMVKANAYGHGLTQVVEHCQKQNLIQEYGCASLGEALEVKKNVSGFNGKLYVFSDTELDDKECASYYSEDLIPVVHRLEDLDYLMELEDVPVVLKFNTGMNRLGISPDDLDKVVDKLKKKKRNVIHHAMSHFANSYIPLEKQKRTQKQYEQFKSIVSDLKGAGFEIENTSMANSGAIEQNYALEETHIRPGLMLYGPKSLYPKGSEWNGKIISSLKTRIISVNEVKKGTPVGYGGHVCHADGLVAIIPLGYGDGLFTYYSGAVLKHGEFNPKILGRVNMDLIQLYFPPEAIGKVKVGDEVVFWDESQQATQELAMQLKTIPYQLYCALSERLPRKYV